MSTMPEATITDGRISCAPGSGVMASSGLKAAVRVRTKAPAIWLKKYGTRALARAYCVNAARIAATKASTMTIHGAPNMTATPTASMPWATTTAGGRYRKAVRRMRR